MTTLEINRGFSEKVPKGAVVVCGETADGRGTPVFTSDSERTDLFALGAIRHLLYNRRNCLLMFSSEAEAEAAGPGLERALEDLLDNE